MWVIRLRLDGCGDNFFTSDHQYEHINDAVEFLGYMQANYPSIADNFSLLLI